MLAPSNPARNTSRAPCRIWRRFALSTIRRAEEEPSMPALTSVAAMSFRSLIELRASKTIDRTVQSHHIRVGKSDVQTPLASHAFGTWLPPMRLKWHITTRICGPLGKELPSVPMTALRPKQNPAAAAPAGSEFWQAKSGRAKRLVVLAVLTAILGFAAYEGALVADRTLHGLDRRRLCAGHDHDPVGEGIRIREVACRRA